MDALQPYTLSALCRLCLCHLGLGTLGLLPLPKPIPVHLPAASVFNTSLWVCAAAPCYSASFAAVLAPLTLKHELGGRGESSQGLYNVCKPNFLFLSIDSVRS